MKVESFCIRPPGETVPSDLEQYDFSPPKNDKIKIQPTAIFLGNQNVGAWAGPGKNHTTTQFCRVLAGTTEQEESEI